MSASDSGRRGGQPSTTAPMPAPCDSPHVVTRKSWPQVLPTARGYRSRAGLQTQGDVEPRGVAGPARGGHREQLTATVPEEAVALVGQAGLAAARVGLEGVDAIAERVVEVDLRGEFLTVGRTDLEVDVHRPTRIPAGVDRREPSQTGRGRRLVAAQELPARRAAAGVLHVR